MIVALMSVQQLFAQASQEHQAGRLDRAESLYRQVLAESPGHPVTLHRIGLIYSATGRHDQALESMRRAEQQSGNDPAFYVNYGEVLRQAGKLEDALPMYQRAIALAPQFAEAHFNQGNVLKQLGRHEEAAACYTRALQIKPGFSKAQYNYANTLREQGLLKDAIAAYETALKMNPAWPDALNNLATTYFELHDLEPAIETYKRAIAFAPEAPDRNGGLGDVYQARGDIEKAREHYRREIQLSPKNWLRRLRLETFCELVAPSNQYIDEYRAGLLNTLDKFIAEQPRLDLVTAHNTGAEPALHLAYQGRDELPVKARYAKLFAPSFAQGETPRGGSGKPHACIVVTRGHEGVFKKCMGGILNNLNASRLKLTIACARSAVPYIKSWLKYPDPQYLIVGENIEKTSQLLRAGNFDLIHYRECGTDSTNYFLPFFRLAPVQSTANGWPDTTGIPNMDYFMSSERLEPENAQRLYSERLVQFKSLYTFYTRPPVPRLLKTREQFGLAGDFNLYVCGQNLRKYHPDFDAMIAGILRADPRGKLVFIGDRIPQITEKLLRRFRASMPDVMDRIGTVKWMSEADYLNFLAIADVVLDTPHYTAGINTCADAVVSGIPMVTMPRDFNRGRFCAAAWRSMGITDGIASSVDEYVKIAVGLGTDPERRSALREKVLANNGAIFEDKLAVREFEDFWVHAIEHSRAGKTPAEFPA
ncbi:MAG: tetratricopeptide repeat protein [Planctomycetes bacterium]|nr:tetratricopeptide repeat protein [Planctomycetota bacterium]